MRRKRAERGWDEGATAVEMALVLSVFMLLLFGVVALSGYGLWQWNTMMLAVQQAGRYAMINNTTCGATCGETQMQAVLTSAAVCTAPTPGQMCVNATTAAGPPPTMTLTAAYKFNLVPLIGSFTMTSQGVFPLD